MSVVQVTCINSPFGNLIVKATEEAVVEINIAPSKADHNTKPSLVSGVLAEACIQLEEYFAGKRKEFSVSFVQDGTDFQKKIWAALQKIPFGRTVSYLDIAKLCGSPGAVRAVGRANSTNKIPILIPCHRVIGKNGNLVGYSGGITTKIWLLDHESRHSVNQQLPLF